MLANFHTCTSENSKVQVSVMLSPKNFFISFYVCYVTISMVGFMLIIVSLVAAWPSGLGHPEGLFI